MKRNRALLLLLPLALAQCNRAPAPSAVESIAPARPSVALIEEGLSPHFLTVASRLEVGGSAFSYLETGATADLLTSFIDQLFEVMPPEERAKLPPNFSAKKIMALFGFDAVKAAGNSSRALPGGRHHAKAFAYTPEGRSGLLALSGGPAEPLLTRHYAVQDTDLALEFPLRLKDWFAEAWTTLMEIAPEDQRAGIESGASEKIPGVNLSVREIAEQLDLRLALLASLRPEQQVPLPNAPAPLPGIDAALVIDRLGPLRQAIQDQLAALPPGLFESSEQDGVLSVRMSQPAMPPPMDFQPALQFHLADDRLILATRPAYLEALLAETGKLTAKPEFTATWTGLPAEGNACFYLSSRFMTTLMDSIKKAAQAQPASASGDSFPKALTGVIDTLGKDLAAPQAFAYANEKDGILAASNSSFGGAQLGSLSGITTLSILASLAVPTFNSIQHKANQTKSISQARQIGLALKTYAADHAGRYPADLNMLVDEGIIEDVGILLYQDSASGESQPWLYNGALTDTSPQDAILLAAPAPDKQPSGRQTRVVVFNDLTTQALPEDDFQARQDPNLR